MTDENAWMRDRLFQQAGQLGAQEERQRSLGASNEHLRVELKDGLAGIKGEMVSQYNHVRGEIASLRDEERRRQTDLLERFEDSEQRSRKLNRVLLFGFGAVIVGGQQLVEHLPQILSLLGP